MKTEAFFAAQFRHYFPEEDTPPPFHSEAVQEFLRNIGRKAKDNIPAFFEKLASAQNPPEDHVRSILYGLGDYMSEQTEKGLAEKNNHHLHHLIYHLADMIPDWLQRFDFLWTPADPMGEILPACAVFPAKNTAPLLMCIYRLAEAARDDPELRAKAAKSAMILAFSLSKNNTAFPPLLSPVLYRLATDRAEKVRSAILSMLLPLAATDPEGAWKLFRALIRKPWPGLWRESEPFLLERAVGEVDYVLEVLPSIREDAAVTWGKTAAAIFLSGGISKAKFLRILGNDAGNEAWAGILAAFAQKEKKSSLMEDRIFLANQSLYILPLSPPDTPHLHFYRILESLLEKAPVIARQILENWIAQMDETRKKVHGDLISGILKHPGLLEEDGEKSVDFH